MRKTLLLITMLLFTLILTGCLGDPMISLYFEPDEIVVDDYDQEYSVHLKVETSGFGTFYVEKIDFYMEFAELDQTMQIDLMELLESMIQINTDDVSIIEKEQNGTYLLGYSLWVDMDIPTGSFLDAIFDIVFEDVDLVGDSFDFSFTLSEIEDALGTARYEEILATVLFLQEQTVSGSLEFYLDVVGQDPNAQFFKQSRASALKITFCEDLLQ